MIRKGIKQSILFFVVMGVALSAWGEGGSAFNALDITEKDKAGKVISNGSVVQVVNRMDEHIDITMEAFGYPGIVYNIDAGASPVLLNLLLSADKENQEYVTTSLLFKALKYDLSELPYFIDIGGKPIAMHGKVISIKNPQSGNQFNVAYFKTDKGELIYVAAEVIDEDKTLVFYFGKGSEKEEL